MDAGYVESNSSAKTLPHLEQLTQLRRLAVFGDVCFHLTEPMTGMTNLTELSVWSEVDCCRLAHLPTSLESLQSEAAANLGAGLASLAQLPRLRDLSVITRDAQLVDGATLLPKLTALTGLTALSFSTGRRVFTPEQISQLAAALPGVAAHGGPQLLYDEGGRE